MFTNDDFNGNDRNDRSAPGTVKEASVIKAGCGIRFDPDELTEGTGFDFSGAEKLKDDLEQEKTQEDDTNGMAV